MSKVDKALLIQLAKAGLTTVGMNDLDSYGRTGLMRAVLFDSSMHQGRLLLKAGADPSIKGELPGNRKYLLHWASMWKEEWIPEFAATGASIEQVDEKGQTAIFIARKFNPAAVLELLKLGANIHHQDDQGLSMWEDNNNRDNYHEFLPFNWALGNRSEKEMLNLLIKNGCNPNSLNSLSQTPLMKAVMNRRHEAIEVLLKYDVDLSIKAIDGSTVFDFLDRSSQETKDFFTKIQIEVEQSKLDASVPKTALIQNKSRI